ncbi:MAG: hypothetical protein WDW38_000636 [Sanguina aurantia]
MFPSNTAEDQSRGAERWLAPPQLRNYIFRRELPLVLESILYADQELVALNPQLEAALVVVHFDSHLEGLNSVETWGIFGQRSTWQQIPTSILSRLFSSLMGGTAAMPALVTPSPPATQQPPATAPPTASPNAPSLTARSVPAIRETAAMASSVFSSSPTALHPALTPQCLALNVETDSSSSSSTSSTSSGKTATRARNSPPSLSQQQHNLRQQQQRGGFMQQQLLLGEIIARGSRQL